MKWIVAELGIAPNLYLTLVITSHAFSQDVFILRSRSNFDGIPMTENKLFQQSYVLYIL